MLNRFSKVARLSTLRLVVLAVGTWAVLTAGELTSEGELRRQADSDAGVVQPVNAVVGDAGYVTAFGVRPSAHSSETLRIRAHLWYVEDLLRERSTTNLTPDQAHRREQALDHLHAYWTRGDFPRNVTHVGRRTPVFVDRMGRRCAVAYLIEQTAGPRLVNTINDRFKFAQIPQMDVPILHEWAEENGFSIEELTMIQPMYDWHRPSIEDERQRTVELVTIGINASSALVNGLMAANRDRSMVIAGAGLVTGGAGLALGVSGRSDYTAATLSAAGASLLMSGWHLLKLQREDDDAAGETGGEIARRPQVSPTLMDAGAGSYQPAVELRWRF